VLLWAKEQNEEKSPNLTQFTEHFNNMSYWYIFTDTHYTLSTTFVPQMGIKGPVISAMVKSQWQNCRI